MFNSAIKARAERIGVSVEELQKRNKKSRPHVNVKVYEDCEDDEEVVENTKQPEETKEKTEKPKQEQQINEQQIYNTTNVGVNNMLPQPPQDNSSKVTGSSIAARFIRQPQVQQQVVIQQQPQQQIPLQQPVVIPATVIQQQSPLDGLQTTIPIQIPVRPNNGKGLTAADLSANLTKDNKQQQNQQPQPQQQNRYNVKMPINDKVTWLRARIVTQGLELTEHQLDILHEVLISKLLKRRCKEYKADNNQLWVQDQSLLSIYDTDNYGYNFAMSKAVYNNPSQRILVMIKLQDETDTDGVIEVTGYPYLIKLINVQ